MARRGGAADAPRQRNGCNSQRKAFGRCAIFSYFCLSGPKCKPEDEIIVSTAITNHPKAMNSHIYCVIMAGGAGTRFWPISRSGRPKQFLDILGTGKTFIRSTFERFAEFVPAENRTATDTGRTARPQHRTLHRLRRFPAEGHRPGLHHDSHAVGPPHSQ